MNAPTPGAPVLLDAHQHFWRLHRGDYGWLKPDMTSLYRDFEPKHLLPLLRQNGIAATVLVQAAPTVAETHFLLSLARQNEFIAGVVGWIDFECEQAADLLAYLCEDEKLVGVRPMLQDMADDDWLLRPEIAPAVRALIDQNLTFDALIRPGHLRTLFRFCARHPDLKVVVDHAAKPRITSPEAFKTWADDLKELARHPQVCCKLSGLVTEAGCAELRLLKPYVDHVLECFGPWRVMWGSDWPVCEIVCGYGDWVQLSHKLLAGLAPHERQAVFSEVGCRAYGIEMAPTKKDGS
jgi:L-fuconolactonase